MISLSQMSLPGFAAAIESTYISRGASILALLIGVVTPSSQAAPEPPPRVDTYIYKTVGSLAIRADVYRKAGKYSPRPVVVWIHGGSLIDGGRQNVLSRP